MNDIEKQIINTTEIVGKLGGNFKTLDMFFFMNEDKLKIESAPGTKKSIYVLRGGIKSKSNTETIRYLLEYFIFIGIVDINFAKKFKNIPAITEWMLKGNTLNLKYVKKYERLSDYIFENSNELMDFYADNADEKWGKKIFLRHLRASYEIEFNDNIKFNSHKNVWKAIVEGQYIHFSGWLRFFGLQKDDLFIKNKIPSNILKDAKKIADKVGEGEYKKSPEAEKLRRKFKYLLQLKVIREYGEEINENKLLKDFPVLEGAHIVPVYYLLKKNRMDDISNPNNGLLIDPNLHKIIDNTDSIFNTGKIVLEGNVMGIVRIDKNKKKYVEEFNDLRNKKII